MIFTVCKNSSLDIKNKNGVSFACHRQGKASAENKDMAKAKQVITPETCLKQVITCAQSLQHSFILIKP